MTFVWDEAKRRLNLAKHGLDFADAHEIAAGFVTVRLDRRRDYGEDRHVATGLFRGELVVVVIYTKPAEDVVRFISFRRATTNECRRYQTDFTDGLGARARDEG